ncbi:hypothetical protein GGI43DRAFT_401608 [Trichoderma evansii]
MKLSTLGILALTGSAAAWWGQLNSGDQSGPWIEVYLTDYNTGSGYYGTLWGGWGPNGVNTANMIYMEDIAYRNSFVEDTGGYTFNASLWQTSDGCYNIDFEGAFSGAGHGYCCDGLPCDIGA